MQITHTPRRPQKCEKQQHDLVAESRQTRRTLASCCRNLTDLSSFNCSSHPPSSSIGHHHSHQPQSSRTSTALPTTTTSPKSFLPPSNTKQQPFLHSRKQRCRRTQAKAQQASLVHQILTEQRIFHTQIANAQNTSLLRVQQHFQTLPSPKLTNHQNARAHPRKHSPFIVFPTCFETCFPRPHPNSQTSSHSSSRLRSWPKIYSYPQTQHYSRHHRHF